MITSIEIEGFKSLKDRCKVDFKGLTILAGANSSGKSSVMQPLLLFKQTLEATYDPGILKLDGPNVYFESFVDFFSFSDQEKKELFVRIFVSDEEFSSFEWGFEINRYGQNDIDVIQRKFEIGDTSVLFNNSGNFQFTGNNVNREFFGIDINKIDKLCIPHNSLIPDRIEIELKEGSELKFTDSGFSGFFKLSSFRINIPKNIGDVIHVPGIRKRPEYSYKITGANKFVGRFDLYVASIIHVWQNSPDFYHQNSDILKYCLKLLGLTGSIATNKVNDTSISLKVSPLPKDEVDSERLVDISDVGYGVSQVLPVLVALIEAKEGQMVYIEQPELHLHPNAQYLLAQPFVDAVNRGVNVVMETHSSILLLAIQTAVANGELDPDKVSLNWFERNPDTGFSTHTIGQLGSDGGFGEWPVDFDDVELKAARKFIEAQNRKA